MPGRKLFSNSPYDEHGMPMGTTYADYDNAEEIRINQVKSTYEEPLPINDPDYQPKQFTKKETGLDRNHGLPYGKKGFNSGLTDPEVENMPTTDTVDIEDPAERKELLVSEAVEKGFGEVPELPKTEKEENVDKVKENIKEDKGEDFLNLLEEEPNKPEQAKDDSK